MAAPSGTGPRDYTWSMLAAVAVVLYCCSLLLPALIYVPAAGRPNADNGFTALMWGWEAVFALNIAWYANALGVLAVVLAARGSRGAWKAALWGALVGLQSFFFHLKYSELWQRGDIDHLGAGFYVWEVSFVVLALALYYRAYPGAAVTALLKERALRVLDGFRARPLMAASAAAFLCSIPLTGIVYKPTYFSDHRAIRYEQAWATAATGATCWNGGGNLTLSSARGAVVLRSDPLYSFMALDKSPARQVWQCTGSGADYGFSDNGLTILTSGWSGPLEGTIAWYANCFALYAFYVAWRKGRNRRSGILASIAIAVGLTAFAFRVRDLGEGQAFLIVDHLGPGFYVWEASFVLLALSQFERLPFRAIAPVLALLVFTGAQWRDGPTFSSAETGSFAVTNLFGNTPLPWSPGLNELSFSLATPSKRSLLQRYAQERKRLRTARIDDAADGLFYALENVEVIGFRTRGGGYATEESPVISVTFASFRMKCGPPTCLQPLHYP